MSERKVMAPCSNRSWVLERGSGTATFIAGLLLIAGTTNLLTNSSMAGLASSSVSGPTELLTVCKGVSFSTLTCAARVCPELVTSTWSSIGTDMAKTGVMLPEDGCTALKLKSSMAIAVMAPSVRLTNGTCMAEISAFTGIAWGYCVRRPGAIALPSPPKVVVSPVSLLGSMICKSPDEYMTESCPFTANSRSEKPNIPARPLASSGGAGLPLVGEHCKGA
mmetsp:Transcript_3182/g.6125  ORF Transcript_3182/g.6125 Transcript_3182/m.6125 type:complete len:221 (-) Transcript_3182:1556-2218(-)